MWANVQNSIVSAGDDPIGAASAGADAVLGPSFDYLKTIQSPAAKGVSSAGTLDQVFTNTAAIGGYVGNLLLGPKVGNQMFSDTGGTCKTPDGTLAKRWTWINNKLGSDDAAGILGSSFKGAVGGGGLDGIVPGIGGDIASLNPLKVMNALALDGSPPCKAFTCRITDDAGVDRGTETRFLSPSLELNMNGCSPASQEDAKKALAEDVVRLEAEKKAEADFADAKKAAAPTTAPGETFAPYFSGGDTYGPHVLTYNDPTPTILLCAAVAVFIGYVVLVKKRR
jgi:hypothetical protein